MSATPAQDQSKSAIAAVRAIITSLQLSLKMLTLYAEDHVYCEKSILRVHVGLESFHSKFGTLVLEVRSDCLLYEGDTVHEGTSKDGDLAFALFRDGVLELIFLNGIEMEEVAFLIRTIDRYRSLATTAEGDIVTALWEARLPHIHHIAAENILEIDQGKQTPSADSKGFQIPDLPAEAFEAAPPGGDQTPMETTIREAVKHIEFPPVSPMGLQLSPEEADDLEDMVRSEEERDATQEIMDMMGDILKDQQDEEFFAYILEYMLEEFAASLKRKDFQVAFRIMQTLHQVRKLSEESRAWALSRIHGFFSNIGRPEFLEGLKEVLPTLTAAQINTARKVLGLLSPEAILGLGPILTDVSGPVSEMIGDVLISLASRDIRHMEQLLKDAEEPLVFRLVPLLGRMDGNKSFQMLLESARHPAERVRLEALRAINKRKLWTYEKMGLLLDDESNLIRRLAIKYLGVRKSEVAEGLLVKYIRNGKFDGDDSGELIACFKALGKCGTPRSLPFLKEALLKGGWLSRFRTSPRRQGAAIALAQFGTKQSLQVLEEAARSPFPAVRNAVQAAYEDKGGEP
jgi:hypothetical protein